MAEDNGLGVEFKYLIVNDMDRKFGLWVNTLGYQSIPPDSPYPLKEHSVSKNKIFEMSDVGQKIEQAKIIMNENVAGNVDPEELAMRLNISYSWFRRVFKEYTGYAPAKYFQELKLRKAKQLLVGTSQSVKEILFSWFPVYRILLFFFQEAYRAYFVGVSFVWERRVNL